MQTKLLRVLQERTFERLGNNGSRELQARIICATNRELPPMIQAGLFRADFYYRINTIGIEIPPLRERPSDVALLVHKFLEQSAAHHQRPAKRVSPAALGCLRNHAWPGNVRELQHAIEHAVLMCDASDLQVEHLPHTVIASQVAPRLNDSHGTFEDEIRSHKRKVVQRALVENGYRRIGAARSLKISRASLHRLMRELEISEGDWNTGSKSA
jgi:transcriptional regulator with PAS, ATPase and Fis domain